MPDDRLTELLHQVDRLPVGLGDPGPVRARGLRLRRRRRAAAGTAALALVVGVVLGGSVLLGSGTTSLQPAPQATAPPSVPPAPSPSPEATPAPPVEANGGPALPVFDGVDVGFVTELAGEGVGRYVVLNRVELLEGDALADFYSDQGLPPPDDATPQVTDAGRELLTYPVDPAAALVSLEDPATGDPVPSGLTGPVGDLTALLALPRPDRPDPVFELEVRGGVVVGIRQLAVAIG